MSPRPRPSRPHGGGAAGPALPKSERREDHPDSPQGRGATKWRELRRLWRSESQLQSPRPREPRPTWGELPKPRLQSLSLPHT